MRHTSLRKPSFSNINNSSNISACPAPPPTPHCVYNTTGTNTNTATAAATTTTLALAVGTGGALTACGGVTSADLSLTNSHINQQQTNYFEFPPKASLLHDSTTVTSLSAPSLATTTAVALAAATAPNSSTGPPSASTLFAAGATGCQSANNSPKSIYYYQHHHTSHTHQHHHQHQYHHTQHHHHHQQHHRVQELQHKLHSIQPTTAATLKTPSPIPSPLNPLQQLSTSSPPTPSLQQSSAHHTIAMGRREIKRSNTSGSTTKSYDSGSGKYLITPTIPITNGHYHYVAIPF